MRNRVVLWVDDDHLLVRAIKGGLTAANFDVTHCAAPDEALEWLRTQRPDLIMLDVDLQADRTGFDLCRLIRTGGWTGTYSLRADDFTAIPIIMLTSMDQFDHKLEGVNAGSDVYMPKNDLSMSAHDLAMSKRDLDLRLLLEYMNAFSSDEQAAAPESGTIRVHDLMIDPARQRVVAGTKELELSPTEYKLLLWLAKHPGLVQDRRTLYDEVWQEEAYPITSRALDACIRRLRKSLDDTPCADLIGNKSGVGYFLKN